MSDKKESGKKEDVAVHGEIEVHASPPTNNNRTHTFLVVALIIAGCGLIYRAVSLKMDRSGPPAETVKTASGSCQPEVIEIEMPDSYLRGIASKGDTVKVDKGFYNCNPVQRGDVVLFNVSEKLPPVLKIVRAVPEDMIELEKNEKLRRWEIKVNGDFLVYRDRNYYFGRIDGRNQVRQYFEQHGGKIQKDDFIIFSLIPPGIQDSGTFGVIQKKDLIGKVLVDHNF